MTSANWRACGPRSGTGQPGAGGKGRVGSLSPLIALESGTAQDHGRGRAGTRWWASAAEPVKDGSKHGLEACQRGIRRDGAGLRLVWSAGDVPAVPGHPKATAAWGSPARR
jgi:hypothetical protein